MYLYKTDKTTKFYLAFEYGLDEQDRRVTYARVFTEPEEPFMGKVWYGMATCSKQDQFSKKIGRKRALDNLLMSNNFNREDRTAIWLAYWSKVKK